MRPSLRGVRAALAGGENLMSERTTVQAAASRAAGKIRFCSSENSQRRSGKGQLAALLACKQAVSARQSD